MKEKLTRGEKSVIRAKIPQNASCSHSKNEPSKQKINFFPFFCIRLDLINRDIRNKVARFFDLDRWGNILHQKLPIHASKIPQSIKY